MMLLPLGLLFWTASADEETKGGTIETERLGANIIAFADSVRPVSFSRDIQPLFNQRCVFCHGPNSIVATGAPNGLMLDTYENVIFGSNFLPVLQAGQPENSTIVTMLEKGTMPAQGGPLSEGQIALVRNWIAQGAPDN
jgi:uncharacterized membrane protein